MIYLIDICLKTFKINIKYNLQKDAIINQCIRLTQSLVSFTNSRPIDEVKLSIVGIYSILGNLRSVVI